MPAKVRYPGAPRDRCPTFLLPSLGNAVAAGNADGSISAATWGGRPEATHERLNKLAAAEGPRLW
jgi:hypothetical protein